MSKTQITAEDLLQSEQQLAQVVQIADRIATIIGSKLKSISIHHQTRVRLPTEGMVMQLAKYSYQPSEILTPYFSFGMWWHGDFFNQEKQDRLIKAFDLQYLTGDKQGHVVYYSMQNPTMTTKIFTRQFDHYEYFQQYTHRLQAWLEENRPDYYQLIGLFEHKSVNLWKKYHTHSDWSTHRQMQTAIDQYDVDTLRKLLDQGASPNSRDQKGDTILYYTVNKLKCKDLACIQLLLERGADVNLSCGNGLRPLGGAMICSNRQVLRLLLDNNADLHYHQTTGYRFLDGIMSCTYKMDALEILKGYGVDPTLLNTKGHCALYCALNSFQYVLKLDNLNYDLMTRMKHCMEKLALFGILYQGLFDSLATYMRKYVWKVHTSYCSRGNEPSSEKLEKYYQDDLSRLTAWYERLQEKYRPVILPVIIGEDGQPLAMKDMDLGRLEQDMLDSQTD